MLQVADAAEWKEIQFTADMEAETTIWADEKQTEQIWKKLLDNAMKYTKDGGTIHVIQTSFADTVKVSISDSGCGMSAENCKRFEAEWKKKIRQIDGDVKVMSVWGRGSIVTVTLPME